MNILIISNVWPEPSSSAAGYNSLQLMRAFEGYASFKKEDLCLVWASTAAWSQHALPESEAPCSYQQIKMNDEQADQQIRALSPDIVVFDSFMTEEQFGWRVREQCPDAARILHTQDLHFLRRARQKKPDVSFEQALLSKTAVRELASVYRCDLSLIISKVELQLLTEKAGVPEFLLHYFPLAYTSLNPDNLPDFEQRRDFVSIGNFLHPPNVDAVLYLKQHFWPEIRKRLPEANLHVYGAYCPDHIMKMSEPSEGFLVHGRTSDLEGVLGSARILLAPLRFGAGLKGKLLDAIRCGTPSVTSKVGAEGLRVSVFWPGYVYNPDSNVGKIADITVRMYEDAKIWQLASETGLDFIKSHFNEHFHSSKITDRLNQLIEDLPAHRNKNIVGRLLCHHAQASTRYMSLWIQEKEKNAKNP
jgi:glycosyltransferase involved in cell wall biosynthesis